MVLGAKALVFASPCGRRRYTQDHVTQDICSLIKPTAIVTGCHLPLKSIQLYVISVPSGTGSALTVRNAITHLFFR